MFRGKFLLNAVISVVTIASLNLGVFTLPARAGDLVPSDDLTSGASVFVFRESRKKPQSRAGGGFISSSGGANAGGGVGARRARLNAEIAASRKKKAAAAKARQAEIARARARERNAKLKLSNTLTARADKQLESGDVAGATTNYREALKANPKNAEASRGLSESLTAKGIETAGNSASESAIVYFEEAVKYNPNNDVAFAKLGEIYDANGNEAKALSNYEKALAIDPEYSALYLPVANAYADANNFAKAEAYLAKAEAAGDSSEVRFTRVDILARQNKTDEAIALLDRIINAEPQNGEAYYRRAAFYDKMNQPDKAVAGYKEAIRVDPLQSQAWFDLGVLYYNRGDYTNAQKAYQEVVRIDGTNGRAHANLASTFRQQEKYPEANAEYKLAEANGIKNADLYSEWGFCLGKTKEWDKSVARLETAKDMSPSATEDSNVGWAYYNAAQEDKAAKNDAAAAEKLGKGKQSLETAVKKDPNLDAAYLNLGSTYNGLGEHDNAVNALNEANRIHGDWAIALNQLGIAYRGLNNLTMALTQFNRVVTIDGNSVVGLFNLGSTQYATGDKKGAKKTQDRLKKIRPDLADQLGMIIAGKLIDAGTNEIRKKIPIPRIPF
jgi:tetratricopeptide (TPR) repeat protein